MRIQKLTDELANLRRIVIEKDDNIDRLRIELQEGSKRRLIPIKPVCSSAVLMLIFLLRVICFILVINLL